WFRPSDVCVAPDGSVFVADWYDPGVGGHGMGDITRGRIYRLAPTAGKGAKPPVAPAIELGANEGGLTALRSPALSVRYMAMASLARMKRADAVKVLEPAVTQKEGVILRARAAWQLARALGKDGGSNKALTALFDDADPRFQVLALRLAKDFL